MKRVYENDSQDVSGKRQMIDESGAHYAAPSSPDAHNAPSEANANGSGWEQHVSKSTGMPFWYNPSTGEKTWKNPRDVGSPPGTPSVTNVELPVRPGVPNCQYYLKTGTCKYANMIPPCKWNHPKDREKAIQEQGGIQEKKRDEPPSSALRPASKYPIRPGMPDCQFFMKTGTCKFGDTCKFNHQPPGSRPGGGGGGGGFDFGNMFSAPSLSMGTWETHFNNDGVPYYFNPVTLESRWDMPQELVNQTLQLMGGVMGMGAMGGMGGMGAGGFGAMGGGLGMNNPFDMSSYGLPGAAKTAILPQRPGEPECAYYMKTGTCKYADHNPPCRFHHPIGRGGTGVQHPYPQRPGEPECQFFMKTGACKYGTDCRYHHPTAKQGGPTRVQPLVGGRLPALPTVPIPGAPPERPGEPECTFYMKTGTCKFGPSCKFHHPAGHKPPAL